MAEEKPKYKILRRRTIRNVNLAGETFEVIVTTFQSPGKPPRHVFIPKEEWSKEKEEKEIIKKILKERAA